MVADRLQGIAGIAARIIENDPRSRPPAAASCFVTITDPARGSGRELADKGVELLAVNMEEQPDQVKATLERHKLKFPVALDRDGVVAAKYAVTAIPQTVVIDRDGKVARLYVGGGKKTADALRKVLQELTAAPPAPANP